MAKKFYVVWQGRKPGIYTDWASCKAQVDGFAGAKYKSYPTNLEAEQAFAKKPSFSTKKPAAATKAVKTSKGSLTAADVLAVVSQYKIFTDGGCEPNPGQAGSGMAVYVDNDLTQLWFGCYQAMGTNNTAELNALYQAMLLAQKLIADNKTVSIFSDSKYSIQCLTQWASGWQKKGWKRSGGEIQNLDLIKPMFALYQQLETKLQLLHVNGHVGIEGNELADRMSILAIDKKQTLFSQYQQALDIKQILALRQG